MSRVLGRTSKYSRLNIEIRKGVTQRWRWCLLTYIVDSFNGIRLSFVGFVRQGSIFTFQPRCTGTWFPPAPNTKSAAPSAHALCQHVSSAPHFDSRRNHRTSWSHTFGQTCASCETVQISRVLLWTLVLMITALAMALVMVLQAYPP